MDELELTIRIEVRQPRMGNSGLSLSESLLLKPKSFLEMCQILAKFQEHVGKNQEGTALNQKNNSLWFPD